MAQTFFVAMSIEEIRAKIEGKPIQIWRKGVDPVFSQPRVVRKVCEAFGDALYLADPIICRVEFCMCAHRTPFVFAIKSWFTNLEKEWLRERPKVQNIRSGRDQSATRTGQRRLTCQGSGCGFTLGTMKELVI